MQTLLIIQVTIHNIGESNFLRDQSQSLLTNGVEITRVTGPSQNTTYGINPNLAVGSHRQPANNHELNSTAPEFGGMYCIH